MQNKPPKLSFFFFFSIRLILEYVHLRFHFRHFPLFFFNQYLLTVQRQNSLSLFTHLKILKIDPTILFTHLKIILQYFQFSVFNFNNNKFNSNGPIEYRIYRYILCESHNLIIFTLFDKIKYFLHEIQDMLGTFTQTHVFSF